MSDQQIDSLSMLPFNMPQYTWISVQPYKCVNFTNASLLDVKGVYSKKIYITREINVVNKNSKYSIIIVAHFHIFTLHVYKWQKVQFNNLHCWLNIC